MTEEVEKLEVLKETTKDCLMNHDQFLDFTERGDLMRPTCNLTADQVVSFAEKAVLNIIELRKFKFQEMSIDKQISEASFIFRRIMEYIGSPNTRLDVDSVRRLQACMCILWTFVSLTLDLALVKQHEQINSLKDKMMDHVGDHIKSIETKYKHQITLLNAKIEHQEREF